MGRNQITKQNRPRNVCARMYVLMARQSDQLL